MDILHVFENDATVHQLRKLNEQFFGFPVETSSFGAFGVDGVRFWDDIVYHGDVHGHGDGGLMTYKSAIGCLFDYDGEYYLNSYSDNDGKVVGFIVDCDPYSDVLEEFRDQHPEIPIEASHPESEDHHHNHSDDNGSHHHHPVVNGYSSASSFRCGGICYLGDPSIVSEDGREKDFVTLNNLYGDILSMRSFYVNGVRKFLVGVFK